MLKMRITASRVAQVVECLLSRHEALNSKPNTIKKKKKERERKRIFEEKQVLNSHISLLTSRELEQETQQRTNCTK
jgi:hypothetical protein